MDVWKEFDENPITHSVAHHLVAIDDLIEEYGYARVSDVARLLEITRGSASITLKRLKQRGLVIEDDRRFLGLSDEGREIARLVKAKKFVMKKLFVELLGVDEHQADVDTCKIEHLISRETAERTTHLLKFLECGGSSAEAFMRELTAFREGAGDVKPTSAEASAAFRYFRESTSG